MRIGRIVFTAGLATALFLARSGDALCFPARVHAEVGVGITKPTATVRAPGLAILFDENNQICYTWMITATIQIEQDNPHIVFTMTGQEPGQYVRNLEGPAQQGSCYSTSISASGGSLESSDAAGPDCWQAGGAEEPPPECQGQCNPSPIVLDLGNDHYRLTSLAGGVEFDLRNEGRRRRVSWTKAGVENAWLGLDRNGNGQIDNGAELFGNFTPLRSGALAEHGFAALAEFDENRDGTLNAHDTVWSRLLLWTDRNHDGRSSYDELRPIAASIVTELRTDYKEVGRKDQWGNQFRYKALFSRRDDDAERHLKYYDVFLQIGN